jgi:hypothetical protein
MPQTPAWHPLPLNRPYVLNFFLPTWVSTSRITLATSGALRLQYSMPDRFAENASTSVHDRGICTCVYIQRFMCWSFPMSYPT